MKINDHIALSWKELGRVQEIIKAEFKRENSAGSFKVFQLKACKRGTKVKDLPGAKRTACLSKQS